MAQAGRLIQQAALKDGLLDGSDVAFLRAAKADFLDSGHALEVVPTVGTLDSVGGMDRLKEWLRLRSRALDPGAAGFGLEAPRGVLLTGVPGCGKSLVAKTIAGTWGLPLPPEFRRKGRFDEIFFVDLPGPDQRREIFRLHLAKRHRDPAGFDLQSLAAASVGFSGAEIEAAVVGALYRAYGAGCELTTDDILAEMRSTLPLSRTRAEEIGGLSAWAARRTIAA